MDIAGISGRHLYLFDPNLDEESILCMFWTILPRKLEQGGYMEKPRKWV